MPEWLIRLLMGGIVLDTAKEGNPGGDPPNPNPNPNPNPDDGDGEEDDDEGEEAFDAKKAQAQIRRLRKENQRYRTTAKGLRTDLDALKTGQKAAIESAVAEALGKAKTTSEETANAAITTLEEKGNKRLMRNAQKEALAAAGCVDIETGLKIIDASGISVNDDGDVVGVAEAITKLKEAKAFLFKAASTTTSHGRPAPAAVKGFDAALANKDERAARAAQLGISLR